MILMKLPKVDGDIKIAGYEKWFVCTSISWGIERNFDESGATGTFDVKLGVPMWTDSIVEIEKTVDESSPDLFRSAVAGGILGDVVEIDFVEQIEEGGEAV
ncbi:MAG: type VI secretion system tube protein Hcp, partial [Planctomycetota bacterium]